MTDFKSLKLAPAVDKALARLGYTQPTPIQQKAIPDVLKGRDLMGIAQTGTGKTAAFSLPTLSHIANHPKDPPKRGARVLILAPTRELASQIAVSVRDYGVSMPELTVTCVFGGVPIARQIKRLVRGNDVLVATPGRLIDLIGRKDVRLSDIEILILDEADQMMDMGFIHALRQIIPHVPKERQTLFFSATMTPQIKKLAAQFLTDPVHVSVAPPNSTADKIEQSLIFVDKKEKQDLLALTLLRPEIERALIFTRTKHGADRVVKRLAKVGIEAIAIHGNKSQGQRTRALAAFREAQVRFLIATDIAARGIDIEGITHVINFEIPNVPEQYVHRIGRTARAGRAGRAIAFVDSEERAYLKGIQKLLKMDIPVEPLPEQFNSKAAAVNKRPSLPKPKPVPHKDARKADRDNKRRQQKRRRPKKSKSPEGEVRAQSGQNQHSEKGTPNKGQPNKGQPGKGKSHKRKSWKGKSGQEKSGQDGNRQENKSGHKGGNNSGGNNKSGNNNNKTKNTGKPKRPPHPNSAGGQKLKRKKRPGGGKGKAGNGQNRQHKSGNPQSRKPPRQNRGPR